MIYGVEDVGGVIHRVPGLEVTMWVVVLHACRWLRGRGNARSLDLGRVVV